MLPVHIAFLPTPSGGFECTGRFGLPVIARESPISTRSVIHHSAVENSKKEVVCLLGRHFEHYTDLAIALPAAGFELPDLYFSHSVTSVAACRTVVSSSSWSRDSDLDLGRYRAGASRPRPS